MMRTALASLPDSPDAALLDELAADFAAIYLTGAFGASPSESYWLSDDHLVCQDAMFDLRKLYAENGLAVPDWRKRPDDHLVFQLQFSPGASMRPPPPTTGARSAGFSISTCCAGCPTSPGALPIAATRCSTPHWRC
jgi:hypothetical protein